MNSKNNTAEFKRQRGIEHLAKTCLNICAQIVASIQAYLVEN